MINLDEDINSRIEKLNIKLNEFEETLESIKIGNIKNTFEYFFEYVQLSIEMYSIEFAEKFNKVEIPEHKIAFIEYYIEYIQEDRRAYFKAHLEIYIRIIKKLRGFKEDFSNKNASDGRLEKFINDNNYDREDVCKSLEIFINEYQYLEEFIHKRIKISDIPSSVLIQDINLSRHLASLLAFDEIINRLRNLRMDCFLPSNKKENRIQIPKYTKYRKPVLTEKSTVLLAKKLLETNFAINTKKGIALGMHILTGYSLHTLRQDMSIEDDAFSSSDHKELIEYLEKIVEKLKKEK